MDRRRFISGSTLVAAGWLTVSPARALAASFERAGYPDRENRLYDIFSDPSSGYCPFVRWWWNGNKVEKGELIRELHLLKKAGIGGVEINPVAFPSRFDGDDLGKPSLPWLSEEWNRMLVEVFAEAKRLDMTCDLIVGSGWPFGSEDIAPEERSQIVVIAVKKMTGPVNFSVSRDEIVA